jgi:hypothetical protein
MLKPKPIKSSTVSITASSTSTSTSTSVLKSSVTWRVPIILDLKAFQHDGSPHYKPPSDGFLNGITNLSTSTVTGIRYRVQQQHTTT